MYHEYGYDEFFYGIIEGLGFYSAEDIDHHLLIASKMGEIEMVNNSYVLFRYKEFYINIMLKRFGEKVIQDYKIVNDLNLETFPRLLEVFRPSEGKIIIVTKISGNTGKNIAECPDYVGISSDVSDSVKHSVIADLKKLESHGYVLNPTFRFCVRINDDGRIIIPDFNLIPLNDAEDRSALLKDVYRRYSMFGNY